MKFMSILSDKETEIVRGLRYPIFRSGSRTGAEYLKMLSDAELLALYEKMDSVIAGEGEVRMSLGSYDEMYVIELSSVKDKIKSEYERRTKSSTGIYWGMPPVIGEPLILRRKGGNVVNVEIVKNENMGERLAAYAEKSAK